MKRRVMGSLMAVLMSTSTILGTCPAPIFATAFEDAAVESEVVSDSTAVDASNPYGLVAATKGNILHAWDWKFTDVTKNIKDIAAAGYSVVQVSPCQVCEDFSKNNDWWKIYQPYDYKFGNSLGSREEFKEMCQTAHEYGVSIAVDVVANHMAGTGEGTCGTRKAEVDPWWTDDKFHNKNVKFTGKYDNDREMMVLSNIGMPDVDTSKKEVQERMVAYLEDLLDMGADGFRFDAAKHIGTTSDTGASKDTFWETVTKAVKAKKSDALVYGETLNGMPVSDEYYVKDGIKVTESQQGWRMKDALRKGGAAAAYTDNGKEVTFKDIAFGYVRETTANNLVTWVENHDTYLNHWGSTGLVGNANYMTDAQIMLGWSTVAARADAQALYFARPDGCSDPKNPDDPDASNTIAGALGMSTVNFDWKDQKVASINKFKNAMLGEKEDCSVEGNLAIIKRGSKGVVVTNFGKDQASFSVSGLTELKDGTYTDASGQNGSFTVSGGKVSGNVQGASFVVLYDADAVVVETQAPATATPVVSETPDNGKVAVTIGSAEANFEKAFEVTVTAKNAEKAYYSYDGAEWTAFTDSAKVKVGEEKLTAGDQVGLYVCAFDKDGNMVKDSATYTKYETTTTTTSEPVAAGLCIKIPKTQLTGAGKTGTPYIYVYDKTHAFNTETKVDESYTGAWPGKALTESGDYYVYNNTAVTGTVQFIVTTGDGTEKGVSWRNTKEEETSLSATGTVEVDVDNNKVTKAESGGTTTITTTVAPTGTKKAQEPKEYPTLEKATEVPTATPEVTVAPTATPEVTATPSAELAISVDKVSGSQFSDETMDVTITAQNATSVSYSIDDGTAMKLDGTTGTIKVGEGKIGNTDVTLKVTAEGADGKVTETYTYKKVFDPEKAAKEQTVQTIAKASVAIKSLFEVVSEAAQVNAAAESEAYYATNPNSGIGAEKTITQMSDFTQDMLVARSGAWDVPNAWHGAHENSVADCYGLYAAWDNDNLYIGLEMVNTTDTWSREGDGPLSDGGKLSDVPVVIAINTGKGNKMTGKCPTDKDGYPWQCHLEFETRIDHMLFASAKGTGNPGLFTADEQGNTDYTEHLVGFKDAGITYKIEDGSIAPEIMHLVGSSSISDAKDISKYQDAIKQGHDRKYDTFFTYTIPFSAIGIDKDYLTTNGIGIMGLGTRQTSALDCIPHDPSMLDNTMEDYSLANDNTSHEKEDLDTITVPLAAVGNVKAIGSGAGTDLPVNPTTPAPSDAATVAPSATAEVTATPSATAEVTVAPTAEVTATPSADVTVAPTAEVTATPSADATATPTPEQTPVVVTPGTTDQMVVNFGADKSAPQLAGNTLTLKAEVVNAKGACTYQFVIDGKVVQKTSESDTYTWYPVDEKSHTIRVAAIDSEGKYVVVEKTYTIKGSTGNIQIPTTTEPTATPVVPTEPVPTEEVPDSVALTAKIKFGVSSPSYINKKITLTPVITGAKGAYKYSITAKLKNGATTTIATNSSKKSVSWTPKKKGTYTIKISVKDSEGKKATKSYTYKINSKLQITTAKVSKKTIKRGQKIKITAAGTAKSGTLRFKFVVKKSGSKKLSVIRKYSTKKTYTWKPKKKGTYTVYVYAKDSTKSIKKTIGKIKVK